MPEGASVLDLDEMNLLELPPVAIEEPAGSAGRNSNPAKRRPDHSKNLRLVKSIEPFVDAEPKHEERPIVRTVAAGAEVCSAFGGFR